MRGRLAEASQDPTLAPWQREFMLDVARGNAGARASGRSPLPGAAKAAVGVTADDGTWIGIPPPSGTYGHTAIYDPVRDRMVVFGGSGNNDVWALSLAGSPAWSELAPTGTPPSPRQAHTAIYDPVRDRMVVFGGFNNGGYLSDAWALTLAGSPTWSELAPTGPPPSARFYHTAIYDPVRDRMLVFGGFGGAGYFNDVWALSMAGSPTWSALAPAGAPPSGRYNHTAIYDPVRDRMVMFGGHNGSVFLNDVWTLTLAGSPAWSALAPAGAPPSGRVGHTAIYDPVRDRMLVFGGYDGGFFNDAWALSLSGSPAWSALAPAGIPPLARESHTAIYDPVRDRMLVFGGNYAGDLLNDVWALSAAGSSAWSEIFPSGMPFARYRHTAIYDPVRDRMLVFGGYEEFSLPSDVWGLSLAGSPAWSVIAPGFSGGRYGHTAIYDPVRDRMLVFGGDDEFTFLNDVWALSLSGSPTWSALAPTGAPPIARIDHTAIYDPVRDRMLVFGGWGGSGYFNDVWALSLAGSPTWSALAPTGAPPSARFDATAVYDPSGDRMVVFGGNDGSVLNDVWALSLAGPAWSELARPGVPPSGRIYQTAIYDPVRDRMLVFGGYGDAGYFNDVWALSLAGSPTWSELAPAGALPSARGEHTAIYDPVRDRMLVFGGFDGVGLHNDVWALDWRQSVSVPGDDHTVPSHFALAAPRPNPSRGPFTLDFTVPQTAHVTLAIYDAAGRRVRELVDGLLPPGMHSTSWDSRDGSGRTVPSGIYLVRLATPGARVVRKAVVLGAGSR